MKNLIKFVGKNLFAGLIFVVGVVFTGVLIVYSATQLSNVEKGETLTSGTLNGIIDWINNEGASKDYVDKPGTIANMVTLQTREKGTYTAPNAGNGTEITPLTLTLTPKKAGNKIVLEWIVNGEMHHDTVYVVTRNGEILQDTTDVSNNRWAGITSQPYDKNTSSTPDNAVVRIIDNNSLDIESNYELRVRSSNSNNRTLYLNRTSGSTGTDGHEAGLSTAVAMEVWQ